MFQARYILILCLFVTFIFFNFSFAEVVKTQEEKRANYVLTNMQQDYTTCYIFYKIGADAIRKSDGETDVVKGMEQTAETSLKFAFDTGELLGMKIEAMSARIKLEMESQGNEIEKNYANISILLKKHGKVCKNLIQNKTQRIDFWEKKALNKFK
ncbi:hypothetical protein OAJ64_00880 [Pelagibacteraceae bacterium]|nr:hypothetical protein [Pelagibacteraceae bacterium]